MSKRTRPWRGVCAALVLAVAASAPRMGAAADRLAGREPVPLLPRPADTEVHRATWARPVARGRAQDARAVGRARAVGAAPGRGWSATMFAKTCWDGDAQPLRLPRAQPTISTPRAIPSCAQSERARRTRRSSIAPGSTAPQGRGGRGKAVTLALRHAGAARACPTPAAPGSSVEIGGRQVAEVLGQGHRSVHRRHGRQLRLRRRQPGRAGALLAGAHRRLRRRRQQGAAARLSGPHRRLEGDRRQVLHRGERALAGPGLPPLALLAPAAGRAAARRRGPASRRDLRRRARAPARRPCSACSCATRATSGCRTRRSCRRFRRWPRRSAPIGRAPVRPARGLSHERAGPGAEGRPGAQEVRRRARAQDRPAAPFDRRQRHRLRQAGRQRRAGRQLDAAPASAAGSARCTALPRPARSSTGSTTA